MGWRNQTKHNIHPKKMLNRDLLFFEEKYGFSIKKYGSVALLKSVPVLTKLNKHETCGLSTVITLTDRRINKQENSGRPDKTEPE